MAFEGEVVLEGNLSAFADFGNQQGLFQGPRGKTGFTFSLYNALGRKNATALGVNLNGDRTAYSFGPMSIMLRWLPSVAFFHTF